MKVAQEILARDSEKEFTTQFERLFRSGASLIHVRTRESIRCILALRRHVCSTTKSRIIEWNITSGYYEVTKKNLHDPRIDGDNIIEMRAVLSAPLRHINGENVITTPVAGPSPLEPGAIRRGQANQASTIGQAVFILNGIHPFIERNPLFEALCAQYSVILPTTEVQLVLVTPDIALPDTVSETFNTLRFAPPGYTELKAALTETVLESVDDTAAFEMGDDDMSRICFAGAGMSLQTFETFAALGMVRAIDNLKSADDECPINEVVDDIIAEVSVGKTEIVNNNDLLELYTVESMSNVGGFGELKKWINARRECFTREATDFGIDSPRGILACGIPGVGKSLIAKAIASEWGIPLIRFDFGRIFNSLVGKSEERMRTALAMVEAMAPCVLWCDEIEKGLAGLGGSNDSGVSSRVLGTYLTWMQENRAPVFTVATANNIDRLPPELLRRGRFDAIFAALLPDDGERMEILKIHLSKRNHVKDFKDTELKPVIAACNGFVGAEIESAVVDALIACFSKKSKKPVLTVASLITACENLVPLSKSHAQDVQSIYTWAFTNALPAGRPFKATSDIITLQRDDASNPRRRRRPIQVDKSKLN